MVTNKIPDKMKNASFNEIPPFTVLSLQGASDKYVVLKIGVA
jgi:hypothetical protein